MQTEIRYLKNSLSGKASSNSITPAMVAQAKQYPFENLIQIKKGKALCPFHDDHNPSMGIKNNRYNCFACGEKGDTISFVMQRDGLSFIDAVRGLQ